MLCSLSPAGVVPGPAAPAPRPLPVVVATAESVDGYLARRSYSGELRPRRAAELGWESAGRVAEVLVDEGDRVDEGQVLARLESQRSSAELAGLRAGRAREVALLAELERGPRPQTVEAARAEVRRLEEELELARLQRDRREQLVASNVLSAEELDVAATQVDTLDAALSVARAQLDELEEGTRVEQLEQQRATLAELDARIELAQVELADRVLRAPFAGVVTRRDLDEGAVVDAGLTVIRIIEAGALEARIGVPVARAAELAPGDPVSLEVRGRTIAARVRSIVPELDPRTRTNDLVVALSREESERHVAGEVVRLTLEEHVEVRGTWIPTAALVPGARGLWAAYALIPHEDGSDRARIARREVEVLYSTGDRALVGGTIRDGDELVVEGVHRVVPGQLVAAVKD